ncbi:ABC transporter ATP-binding protein [Shinella sp.]|uniref:ABC transporter ATP-binding protein n=1 Tax=Shinella sp. TaxID=1870904 RepID=UPI00258B143C|nr:ABC transporter ATP-binding protein [Shinella sp.]MCW5712683.1 ABC transporter ATP-binding protein [Shinella sp.]
MSKKIDQDADAVSAHDLALHYGDTIVLKGIDLSLSRGRTLALLGPSGCGKTTLLRLVAGLLQPTRGTVRIAGQPVADARTGFFAPPERRNLGMVFQDYALWPHLTVGGNVSFPLEMRGVARAERAARTMRALRRVGLEAYVDRRPSDLSGGQQQRVAIARAIVAEPQLILFDEPLSNLDRELRENMVGELAGLIAELRLTAIYVTHDHAEALTLADEVAVMRAGEIAQLAAPDDLVARPASAEVADFLRLGGTARLSWRGGTWFLAGSDHAVAHEAAPSRGREAQVLLPLAAVALSGPSHKALPARVVRSQFRGDGHLATVVLAGSPDVELQLLSAARLRPGEQIGLSIDPGRIRWFGEESHSTQEKKVVTC